MTELKLPARGLLSTRWGRLATFFLLYVTEGIPLGFTATALATLMRKQGLQPDAIGTFVATLYLPWSWKWLVGPVVDMVFSTRLGRRRAWIVACQSLMATTLLVSMGVDFTAQIAIFTAIIFVHNIFAATMDVAIDALAVETLPEDERGTANGLMFAGAYVGNAAGGAGVLFLLPYVSTSAAFLLVAGMILAVMALVSLRLVESPVNLLPREKSVTAEVWHYVKTVFASCFGSRQAIAGLGFAILPAGAYGLGLALQSNLAVELGFDETSIGWLSLWSTVLAATGCVVGGLLSDRLGRRRMMAVYVVATALPTLWLAQQLKLHEWIMPVPLTDADRRDVPSALVNAMWMAALTFSFLQGLMYGTRTAIYMELCRPEVAATQFTAYMSLMNLGLAYSAWWQGQAATRWGYPSTLVLDAALGCVCLLPLALMGTGSPKGQKA